jgi:glycine/D-amino acid oxidase-like deaminating enzyme
MSKRIAVIGGGIFGSTVAIELAKMGSVVTIFEKRNGLLDEATRNSQNRLHLGLHYPRDLPTALQSKDGFRKFKKRFPSAVRQNFDNYYALAKNDSKVSKAQFLSFVSSAQIFLDSEGSREVIKNLNIDAHKFSGIWRSQEGVIDIEELRSLILKEICGLPINLHLSSEVTEVNFSGATWILRTDGGLAEEFDWIIRATYGLDKIQTNVPALLDRNYEYHQTMILEIASPAPSFGFTIVDGDFLTILPKGFTNNFLIYAPSLSVRKKVVASHYPSDWDIQNTVDEKDFTKGLLARVKYWIPGFEISNEVGILKTVRSIQSNVANTDKRTSEVKVLAHNFIDIWSGKIDHCLEIATKICTIISK